MAGGGQRPYRYQWQRQNTAGLWVDIAGANQDVYQIAGVTLAQTGLTLRCVVTDDAGSSVTSDPAVLTVVNLPQTGDGARPWLWGTLALASAVAWITLLHLRRRARG